MAMGGRYNYLQSLETSMTLPFGKVLPLFTRRKKKCQNNQKFAFSKQNPAAVKSSEISKIQEFQHSYLQANPCRFSDLVLRREAFSGTQECADHERNSQVNSPKRKYGCWLEDKPHRWI
jgi:hypothetical protein